MINWLEEKPKLLQKTRTTIVAVLDNAVFQQLEMLRNAAVINVAQVVSVFVVDLNPF